MESLETRNSVKMKNLNSLDDCCDSEDEDIPELLLRDDDDDNPSRVEDKWDEPTRSILSSFETFQEVSLSCYFKIDDKLHPMNMFYHVSSSLSLAFEISCLTSSLRKILLPEESTTNDNRESSNNDPIDMKVHQSTKKVSMNVEKTEGVSSEIKLPLR